MKAMLELLRRAQRAEAGDALPQGATTRGLLVLFTGDGKGKTSAAFGMATRALHGKKKVGVIQFLGGSTTSADYQLRFDDKGSLLEYALQFEQGRVIQETLAINGEQRLNRASGKLWYQSQNKALAFEPAADVLAVTLRNKKQHPFFESLYGWANRLSHYRFGEQMGQGALLHNMPAFRDDEAVDLKGGNGVVKVFVQGARRFAGGFVDAVLADMRAIGYDISAICVGPLKNSANSLSTNAMRKWRHSYIYTGVFF